MPGPCVWWIRKDTRLQDNPVLRAVNGAALCDKRPFIAVYVFDPQCFNGKDAAHALFLIQCVRDVAEQLAARGSKLLVCYGQPQTVLSAVPEGTEMKCLSEPCSPALGAIDKAVEAALLEKGSKLRRDPGAAWLYHPHEWPYGKTREELGNTFGMPQSFETLRQVLGYTDLIASAERREGAATIRACVPAPSRFAPLPAEDLALPGLVATEVLGDDKKMLELLGFAVADLPKGSGLQGGESAARALLSHWDDAGAAVVDGGDWAQVSHYLTSGCITAREVFARAAPSGNAAPVASRLLWRELHRLHDKPEETGPELTVAELKQQLLAKDKLIEELRKGSAATA